MLQRVWKHCVSFFKLYTSKIPWSNHQLIKLINVSVVSYCGKTLRSLSPKAFRRPALTLLGQTPAAFRSKWGTLVYTDSFDLEKCSPLATTFTAEDHRQLNNSPCTPRLQKSPSRPSPDRHAFFLGCHTNTSGFWLSPVLFCSGGPSYNSDIPKKTGHLKRYDLTSNC